MKRIFTAILVGVSLVAVQPAYAVTVELKLSIFLPASAAGAPTFMLAESVNGYLRTWLINRILKTDMAYKPVLTHPPRQGTTDA